MEGRFSPPAQPFYPDPSTTITVFSSIHWITKISSLVLYATGLLAVARAAPPVIQRPPVSQHVGEGSFVRFSVFNPSPVVEYQWFRGGLALTGETSANFELYNVSPADRGAYRVLLRDDHAATWSQEVELEVLEQERRPGMIDTSFSVGSVNGKDILAIAPTPDGKFLLGGSFERFDGQVRTNLVRVHADGSVDLSFNASLTIPGPDTEPEVRAIAIDHLGRVLVGGRFTRCNHRVCENIVRFNQDGSIDSTFAFQANGVVNTILETEERGVLVGGTFSEFGGAAASRLVLLKPDDSIDLEFTQAQTFDAAVNEIVRAGEQYYIAGGFTERIVRINHLGIRDATFNSYRPRSAVFDLAILPTGDLVASGFFSGGIVKLNSSGARDEDFAPRPNDFIYDLAARDDGRIFVAGDFTRLDGQSVRSIACLFPDGNLDESFRPPSLDGPVQVVSLDSETLLAGGDFERPQNNVIRLLTSTPVEASSSPVIVSHPRSRMVWPGQMVTLGVGLENSFGKTYQWYLNDLPILGARSSQFEILNFGTDFEGDYRVVVNGAGVSVSSEVARLSLDPSPALAVQSQFETGPQELEGTGITSIDISVSSDFTLAQVRPYLELTHPKVNDLTIFLRSPGGTAVPFFKRNGRRGKDIKTSFDQFAPAQLDDGAAPWEGTWKPDEDLGAFAGQSALGTWTLEIQDRSGGVNGGRLDLFRLELIAQNPEVNFSNWHQPKPLVDQLFLHENRLCFSHRQWRHAPNLVYEYQVLRGERWENFSPTLLYQENLGNYEDALQWQLPHSDASEIIRLKVTQQ